MDSKNYFYIVRVFPNSCFLWTVKTHLQAVYIAALSFYPAALKVSVIAFIRCLKGFLKPV